MSLAEALRRSNPDRALPMEMAIWSMKKFPPEGILPRPENGVDGAARLSPAAFTPTP